MVCRLKVLCAIALILALSDALGGVRADLTLKELMERDKEEKRQIELGISPTQGTTVAAAKAAKAAAKSSSGDAAATTAAAAAAGSKDAVTTAAGSADKGSPTAASAFAHHELQHPALHAPLMESGSHGAGGQSAALGTSAMVGIGVGVGVACLVAVGSVIGALVYFRRRKSKGSPLEKQKTYGGTE